MKVIADLEVHSKYARAVSQQMTVPVIAQWAAKKGIDLVGTGDFTHPLWFRELETNLEEAGSGIYMLKKHASSAYKLKNSDLKVKFMLTSEVSCMYKHNGRGRRVHLLVYLPTLADVKKFNQSLSSAGANLFSDGRPIIGLSLAQVAQIALEVNPQALLIPAHVWTPWFGFYGSMSGYDSLDEAFGSLARFIPAVETGLSCYDEETEILTDRGWKKFSEVSLQDKVCTLNTDNQVIEFQKPRKIFHYEYNGKMYKLKTKRIDLLVTPNHNLLYSPCDFRKAAKFYLKTAEELFGKSKRFKKDGVWLGKDIREYVLPACMIRHGSRFYSGSRHKQEKHIAIKPWLKFFGFWIAEGWTTKGKNGDYNVCVSNKDQNLLSEMKYILEKLGYHAYQRQDILRVRDYQLFSYLRQFGKAADKFVPPEVKSLSKELLEIFLAYYIKGDGHVYGRTGKGLSATTISTRLRDDLQEIALKIGISAYYKLGNKKGTLFHGALYKDRIYKQSADSWIIYFIRKNLHTVLPSTVKKQNNTEKWLNYNGEVFCVSVPNKVVYVRRNGIPVWSGNSDPAMNWRIAELANRAIVSFGDAHSPQKLGREATVFEMPEISYENVRKLNIASTIEFYPEEGKYHYTGHRNCKVVYSPKMARKKGLTCPVCGKHLTVGVMSRVEELARGDVEVERMADSAGVAWINDKKGGRPPYVMLVPLLEILAEALSAGVNTKKVLGVYEQLLDRFHSEFAILLKAEIGEIIKTAGNRVGEGIAKVRKGDIAIEPGYDGVFGKVKIWSPEENSQESIDQVALF